jgi:hypothetical protein
MESNLTKEKMKEKRYGEKEKQVERERHNNEKREILDKKKEVNKIQNLGWNGWREWNELEMNKVIR